MADFNGLGSPNQQEQHQQFAFPHIETSSTPSHAPLDQPAQGEQSPVESRTVGGFVVSDEEYAEKMGAQVPESFEQHDNGFLNPSDSSLVTAPAAEAQSPLKSPTSSIIPAPQDAAAPSDLTAPQPGLDQEQSALPLEAHSAVNGAQESSVSSDPPLLNGAAADAVANHETSQTLKAQPQAVSSAPHEEEPRLPPKGRLPQDRVGMLEDRIKEDPVGDIDAWMALITDHQKRHKTEETRSVYRRFLTLFPTAAEIIVAWLNWELENQRLYDAEQVLSNHANDITDLRLLTTYINYIRRRRPLTNDPDGNNRKTCQEAFKFVIKTVGLDKDAGNLWQDYINFIKSLPGKPGGPTPEDQYKMDILRTTYTQAINTPTQQTAPIWNDYHQFEMDINKMTGRKFITEKSPGYMTARSAYNDLQNITRDLTRSTIPRLPPAPGCEGEEEFMKQVSLWKKWIDFEQDKDPLLLKEEDPAGYRDRVIYTYKQATMTMRFWPEMWFLGADFCAQYPNDQSMVAQSKWFLEQGLKANPTSCLLAFKLGEQVETSTAGASGADAIKKRAEAVRAPYDITINSLYALMTDSKERESAKTLKIREDHKQLIKEDAMKDDEDDADGIIAEQKREARLEAELAATKAEFQAQQKTISRTLSGAWVALTRAMRRVQGQGSPSSGMRAIFGEARKRGQLTSDVYIASAQLEYHCYQDPAAGKIYERGAKLFPEDEQFGLAYLKHLKAMHDVTNIRAVFEGMVRRLSQKPETLSKTKVLFDFFHTYESEYGELDQIMKLEHRIRELFPEDPDLNLFKQRNEMQGFDPTSARLIFSPSQVRATAGLAGYSSTGGDMAVAQEGSPPTTSSGVPSGNSPKRSLPVDELDMEGMPARKIARAESPLKGAAGRRLDAAKRSQLREGMSANGGSTSAAPPQTQQGPTPLPSMLQYTLSILPRADTYKSVVFDSQQIINLVRRADLSRVNTGQVQQRQNTQQMPQMGGAYGAFGIGGNQQYVPQPPF